jgi:hypothetical protein
MKKILRQSDEKALGGGNPTTQWRRRKSDAEYAKIWFDMNGRPVCFADERDAYWEKQRSKGYNPTITTAVDTIKSEALT